MRVSRLVSTEILPRKISGDRKHKYSSKMNRWGGDRNHCQKGINRTVCQIRIMQSRIVKEVPVLINILMNCIIKRKII